MLLAIMTALIFARMQAPGLADVLKAISEQERYSVRNSSCALTS
jgi:hypothetical protein